MNKFIAFIAIAFLAVPVFAGASNAVEEKIEPELDLDSWVVEHGEAEVILDENFSNEAINHRIAVELIDLRNNVSDLEVLQEKGGWINSLREAWLAHKIGVQIRRIDMLVRSSEKRETIEKEIVVELSEYLELIREEVRE